MNRIAVKRSVLEWALERSVHSLEILKRRFPRIQSWLKGNPYPTRRQLESLAKATQTPLGFFFLEEPPSITLPIPHFRTQGDRAPLSASPDLLETFHTMQLRQNWMREYLIDQGQEKIPFFRSASLRAQETLAAERIRKVLDLNLGWAARLDTWTDALRVFRESIELAGVMLVVNGVVGNNTHRKLDPNEFRGFVLVDDYAPLIFVNGADGKAAQMFTLAHEVAHIFFGSSAAFDLRDMQPADNPTEKACNRVAAEFLVPAIKLNEVWNEAKRNEKPFEFLARQFKVSSIVTARRALDLELITKRTFLEFYREYQDAEFRAARRRSGGGDFYSTQNLRLGRRFASAVIRASKEGKLLYSDAYKLTGLYGKTFDGYAESLGLGGTFGG